MIHCIIEHNCKLCRTIINVALLGARNLAISPWNYSNGCTQLCVIENKMLHKLNEHITDSRKLNLYASFKTNYKFESYLDYIADFTVRCTLAKLRLSAHNLQIETGRFSKKKLPETKDFVYTANPRIISQLKMNSSLS